MHVITAREQAFEIEYYLGGDWKFLAMITGIDFASSTYAKSIDIRNNILKTQLHSTIAFGFLKDCYAVVA